ncbi:MAG: EAL domain-containing protein [Spirochaetaceae bacterium]|nr:MAG: EAL domain-containing protein [Spirochaetaceae bacterium]
MAGKIHADDIDIDIDTDIGCKLAFIVDHSPDYITLITRDYRYEVVNRSYCEAMEVKREEILGRTVAEVWGDEHFHTTIKQYLDQCLNGEMVDYVATFLFGPFERTAQVTMAPYPSADGEVTHVLVRTWDITRYSRIESKLNSYEFYDPITGLLNRRSLETMLEREITGADLVQRNANLALLFIRLHGFEEVIRLHGHRYGDLLLEDTALRIKRCLSQADQVFRFEGDQLAVLIPGVSRKSDVAVTARTICEAISVPYRFKEHFFAVAAHIGVSIYPDDGKDPGHLSQHAVSACMEAQRQNVPFYLYNRQLHEDALFRINLTSDLRVAFEKGQFELHYQPIVENDGHIIGAEALVRWNHPEMGLLQPGEFVEVADASDLGLQMGRWVLFTATKQLASWSDHCDLFISINLSAQDFGQPNLATLVASALRSAGVTEPSRLKLEITESHCMADPDAAMAQMARLSELSVDLWIDDFGTGYSSLGYLKRLPARMLKLDRSFVQEIEDSPEDIVFVATILSSVHARGKDILIEGIENAAQYSILKRIGGRTMQGYYFSKPVPAPELCGLLASGLPLPLSNVTSNQS